MISPCVKYTRVFNDSYFEIISNVNNAIIYRGKCNDTKGIDKFAIVGGYTLYFGANCTIVNCDNSRVYKYEHKDIPYYYEWTHIHTISPSGKYLIICAKYYDIYMQVLYYFNETCGLVEISLYDECIQYDRDLNNIRGDLQDDNAYNIWFDSDDSLMINKISYINNNAYYEYFTRGIICAN